ncbi:MAG: hypothetical protein AAF335_01525 [Bacteroidota bacterium]
MIVITEAAYLSVKDRQLHVAFSNREEKMTIPSETWLIWCLTILRSPFLNHF